jgi:flagellar biosynthesis protein FlhB
MPAMADNQDQKTEQPTGKKLNDAADRGQFARVAELQVLCTLAPRSTDWPASRSAFSAGSRRWW